MFCLDSGCHITPLRDYGYRLPGRWQKREEFDKGMFTPSEQVGVIRNGQKNLSQKETPSYGPNPLLNP